MVRQSIRQHLVIHELHIICNQYPVETFVFAGIVIVSIGFVSYKMSICCKLFNNLSLCQPLTVEIAHDNRRIIAGRQ